MVYALDTNIISCLLRPTRNQDVVERFKTEIKNGNDYVIPPLSHYEILWYLLRKNASAQLSIFNDLYKNSLVKINMGETEFIKADEIRAFLEEKGKLIGNNDADIFIAAYCIINGYILVTDNIIHFEFINGLKFINWKERD